MENLYVIVVTYNAEKWIQKCLNSLLNTNYKLQIIVIDNNSIDNTKSLLSSFSENIEIISLNKNKGFGLANNIGIKIAMDRNADFVFLINQDAYVTNETIPNLLSEAIKNSEYGILSPIHLNGIGTKLDYNFSIQVSPLNCNDFFSDFVIGDNIESVYNCKFVNAAAWLISKNVLTL